MLRLALAVVLSAANTAPAAPAAPSPPGAAAAPRPAADGAAAAPRETLLELTVGEARALSFPGLTRAAIGAPGVADVKLLEAGELLLTAIGAGRTTLLVWRGPSSESLEVVVRAADRAASLRGALRALVATDGLQVVELGNGKLVVDGTVTTIEQHRRLHQLVAGEDVVLLVSLSPAAQAELVASVNLALAKKGLAGAHASLLGGTLVLEGQVQTEEDRALAEKIARELYSGPVR